MINREALNSTMSNQKSSRWHPPSAAFALVLIIALICVAVAIALYSTLAMSSLPVGEQYGAGAVHDYATLFSRISKMVVEFNFTNADGTKDSQVFTCMVMPGDAEGGPSSYEVSLADHETSGTKSDTESLLIWVSSSTGHVVQILGSGESLRGVELDSEVGALSFIVGASILSLLNSTTVYAVGPPRPALVGDIWMSEQDYRGFASFTSLSDWTLTVGWIRGTGVELLVGSSALVPSGGRALFQLVDLSAASHANM